MTDNLVPEHKRLMIMSLSSNMPLAKKVAKVLKQDLTEISMDHFADGEIRLNVNASVRGANVYIIQSTSYPVNDHLMELLLLIDALRRASAKQINVVMPYYGYARQDRKSRSREPITARLVADMLERAGATRVIALDLHAAQIQGFFDIPVDHLAGASLLSDYLLTKKIVESKKENAVVVSPDHGGVPRARNLATFLDLKTPIAVVDKYRPTDKKNTVEIMNVIGDVKDKTAIMIDDMIDTGQTIVQGAEALIKNGAKDVYIVASHGVLSGDAPQTLQNSVAKKIVLLDSIDIPKEKQFDKLTIVSVDQLLAKTIESIQAERSVSPLFTKRFKREN